MKKLLTPQLIFGLVASLITIFLGYYVVSEDELTVSNNRLRETVVNLSKIETEFGQLKIITNGIENDLKRNTDLIKLIQSEGSRSSTKEELHKFSLAIRKLNEEVAQLKKELLKLKSTNNTSISELNSTYERWGQEVIDRILFKLNHYGERLTLDEIDEALAERSKLNFSRQDVEYLREMKTKFFLIAGKDKKIDANEITSIMTQ